MQDETMGNNKVDTLNWLKFSLEEHLIIDCWTTLSNIIKTLGYIKKRLIDVGIYIFIIFR